VVVVQHPRETGMPIGTAHMARLCLPNAELHVGVRVREMPALLRTLADATQPVALLYPGDDARDLLTDPPAGPVTLVVVDGTWSHARKLVRHNPELAALPRYALRPSRPSEYRIRKEPSLECVSTIESLALALGALEGDPERFQALLVPFRAMIDAQIECERGLGKRRTKLRRGGPGRRFMPAHRLAHRAADLVCVVGEANTWPHDTPERQTPGYRSELVQWLAIRVSTGERFEAVVRPNGPLAPRTADIVGLTPAQIAAGLPAPALARAFAEFLRDDDILCTWGEHVLPLFTAMTGTPPPPSFDLRHIACAVGNRRVGTLADYAAATGRVGEPLGEGRGGRRLAEVCAVLAHLQALRAVPDLPPAQAEPHAAASSG
jgi:DTW domain-containing protein YfiP